MTAINRKKLTDIMLDLAKVGVGRNRKNEMQGYMYRGADDVLDVVTPALAKHGVYMRPFFAVESTKDVATKTGTAEQIIMKLEMSLYDADCTDGDNVLIDAVSYGEARDSGDKCIMKAQTAAYKNWFLMVFGIPVIGTENDPDSTSPELEGTYNKRVSKTSEKKKPDPVSIIDIVNEKAPEPVAKEEVKPEVKEEVKAEPKKAETTEQKVETNVLENLPQGQKDALASLGLFC